MNKTAVLNVVGLAPSLIGPATPRLRAFAERHAQVSVTPVLPAVTCSVQATYLTGTLPSEHGVVGNGWYFRDEHEVKFWRRSDGLVQKPKLWERAKAQDPGFTCANLFWRYATYSKADYVVVERPMYPADGRKLPDIYSWPAELRPALQGDLGAFPLFNFWGPNSSVHSSRWIAEAAKWLEERHNPTLSLVYLPHLDYGLQRYGPDLAKVTTDLQEIDAVAGDLIDFYEARGAHIIVMSEYGVTPVSRPVHLNRLFRERGWIAVREELGLEDLNAGMSAALAVADHQVAHVYVNDDSKRDEVRALLETTDGVAEVLAEAGKRARGLDHPRAGDFVVLAEPDAWFTYYFWLDDRLAPDYARTVDIHRKPGYDPAELFVNPALKNPKAKVAMTLLKKGLGFRYLMDVIGLDASVVKGSHGLVTDPADGPLLISSRPELLGKRALEAREVCGLILEHLKEGP
ncbi:MAG: alkaline phosphatase family protein [Deinococcota bacterium]|nr:alkaline phosphatase family protein [Deinococcota bacterium]